jgi:1-acyl-sn-glycerol-3-phosphate acyltransferase
LLYFIIRCILIPIVYLLFWPKVTGKENIPTEESTIVYANHISLLDPIILACVLPRKVNFMAKEELFRFPLLGRFLKAVGTFPVKRGSADISSIKTALKILKEGKVFGIFPEGTRSKNGEMQLFTHGMAAIAQRSKAITIPIAIRGDYRIFRPLHITIGKPLDLSEYYEKKSNSDLLNLMTVKMSDELKKL